MYRQYDSQQDKFGLMPKVMDAFFGGGGGGGGSRGGRSDPIPQQQARSIREAAIPSKQVACAVGAGALVALSSSTVPGRAVAAVATGALTLACSN